VDPDCGRNEPHQDASSSVDRFSADRILPAKRGIITITAKGKGRGIRKGWEGEVSPQTNILRAMLCGNELPRKGKKYGGGTIIAVSPSER